MPPIENIGDNIDKSADGFQKVTTGIKNNPIATAILIIIIAAVITGFSIWHFSSLANDASARQHDRDDAYYLPIVRADNDSIKSLQQMVITLSIEVGNLKAEAIRRDKQIDSSKHD